MSSSNVDLWWMSSRKIDELNESVPQNLDRYRQSGFNDLSSDRGWEEKSILTYDSSKLSSLAATSSGELQDSLLIFDLLQRLEPRLATCMNVWVPLLHTHLLSFLRTRWLKASASDEEVTKIVRDHVFKGGLTGYRDDNAAGKLWWTGYIGSRIAKSDRLVDIESTLRPFMHSTDTRSNVIERPGIFMERGLAKHISDYLNAGRLTNHTDEKVFRSFMVSVNFKSAGRHFGDMNPMDVYVFLDSCR